jgi:hypothetical protein
MEYEPIIASALDIYADEMTTHSSLSPMLNIACPNEEIKAVLGFSLSRSYERRAQPIWVVSFDV